MRTLFTLSTIKRISSDRRISAHKLLWSHMPSPSAYMGYPLSPDSDMGCTYAHTLHYGYYPTYIGLQSLGVTEPMFIHGLYTTLPQYVFMHIPPSSFMASYMGFRFVCVSPPHLLSLIGSKLGGPLPRLARCHARLVKAQLAMHHPT